jgi:crotonobetainyl-CoA:carnitine CoA-transferase CaiB-like acyl-CoA transferase
VTLPEDGRALKLPNLPLSVDGERPDVRHDLPKVGQQSAEIAAELGYSAEEIAALRASRAIL